MNASVVPNVLMRVDEFLAWSDRQADDRYELLDGKIVAMTRDTVLHNRTKFAVARALDDALRAAGEACVVLVDGVGVPINNATVRIPDVLVHCGAEPAPDALIIESPLIVVEVVSPSSEHDDAEAKLVEYFSLASVRDYLVVFSDKRVVVHHRRNDAGSIDARIAHVGDIALDPPGITVPVAALLGPPGAEAR